MNDKDFQGSTVDFACNKFKEYRSSNSLFLQGDKDLTEADTRSKLIDPIFKDILGWSEADISREAPVADGYADYSFGSAKIFFHIEAKRTRPRFQMKTDSLTSRSRRLMMSGPHLYGNKKLQKLLDQTARYSLDLGSPFAILTNGSQFIIFATMTPGRSWKKSQALVWHSHDDIESDFPVFFRLLSKEGVEKGSLIEFFSEVNNQTIQVQCPIEFIHNPDETLIRNELWGLISKYISPLLSVQPDDPLLQDEIIHNCYVTTHVSDEVDDTLHRLLKDKMPKFLTHSGVKDIDLDTRGSERFGARLAKDLIDHQPWVYVLTGGVGSGKTTFLRRFSRIIHQNFIREHCVWIHIDYLSFGNVDSNKLDEHLRQFTLREMRNKIEESYPDLVPSTGEEVRTLFRNEIKKAELTKLFRVDSDSNEWIKEVNDITDRAMKDNEVYIEAILSKIRESKNCVVIVLDNTDQLGEDFQEAVFLLAQHLATKFTALSIVALREEKYFAAYRRGVFDAYGDRKFHIGSPDLAKVLKRRLEHGRTKVQQAIDFESVGDDDVEAVRRWTEIDTLFSIFIKSVTEQNTNIVRMLRCVSNGDMRYALDLFRHFISSGNTDIRKINNAGRSYAVPFHEFAKSCILGDRRYYSKGSSYFINLFTRTSEGSSSHFTAIRLLRRLFDAQQVMSSHGEGFVSTSDILREFRQTFGNAKELLSRGGELLRSDLLESEPPKAQSLDETSALKITASGAYYWRYLGRAFAYLDLILMDTPLTDRSLAQKFSRIAGESRLDLRHQRVRDFVSYLKGQEDLEIQGLSGMSSSFLNPIMPEISEQIEKEINGMVARGRKRSLRRSGRRK